MPSELVQLYDFGAQPDLIAKMQETSLTRGNMGLAPDPLVGSPGWWTAIERGQLKRVELTGVITRVWWGSMADWPEFETRASDGTLTTWTREGDARRYVDGLEVRITYVEHPWKKPQLGRTLRQLVLSIWVENSGLRASGFAPGPGGAGYRFSRRHGEAAHYLYAPERANADAMLRHLQAAGRSGRVWGGGTQELWVVQVWAEHGVQAKGEAAQLQRVAQTFDGRYDGGEIIEGEIWGPLPA